LRVIRLPNPVPLRLPHTLAPVLDLRDCVQARFSRIEVRLDDDDRRFARVDATVDRMERSRGGTKIASARSRSAASRSAPRYVTTGPSVSQSTERRQDRVRLK
jgi:hypothetical protein